MMNSGNSAALPRKSYFFWN